MKHLNKNLYIWLLIIISALAYFLIYTLYPKGDSFVNVVKPLPIVVTIDAIITFIFIKFLWKWKCLYPWFVPFPDLNGTWDGGIMSTWADPITKERPEAIPVILTIKQSFISISCIVRTEETDSYSFISDFVINDEQQVLKLVYSYDSQPKKNVLERSQQHSGTTVLDIISKTKKRQLVGGYWTDRKTTGTLELKFLTKEHLDQFPKNMGKHPVGSLRENEKTNKTILNSL